jgi:hypothetical protein
MRLVTRPDLDGLACALVLAEHEPIDELALVHPQEITDKTVEITADDTLANLPYHPRCGRWFDHHLLTESNEKPPASFDGLHRVAPSAAQLVWEYFGEEPELADMVRETNRFDSAQLSQEDVLQPKGWVLLGFVLDPRTGLGGETELFRQCLDWLREKTITEVLVEPAVRDRIIRMFEQNEDFCWALMQGSRLNGNVVFSDFRQVADPPAGNRFLIYTLFPEANVSVRAQWGEAKQHVMITVGHSIFDRSCDVSVGELMSEYGGGGHRGAGSAPLPVMDADTKILEIIQRLQNP